MLHFFSLKECLAVISPHFVTQIILKEAEYFSLYFYSADRDFLFSGVIFSLGTIIRQSRPQICMPVIYCPAYFHRTHPSNLYYNTRATCARHTVVVICVGIISMGVAVQKTSNKGGHVE